MKLMLEDLDGSITCSMQYDFGPFDAIAITTAEEFNENLATSFSYSPSVLLPPAVRYLSSDHKTIIFERPPCYVSYQLTTQMQEEIQADQSSKHIFRIPIPWQRYIVQLSSDNMIANLFMFFANRPIKDMKEPLLLAPICNFYQTGRLCLASYVNQPEYEHSITGVIDRIYDMIWNSGFNYDTTLALLHSMNANRALNKFKGDTLGLYAWWATLSLEDVLHWDYCQAYRSIDDFLESGHLYHDYTGDAHDILLKIALAVQ
jgi:hypothetical protein